jgi:hypothetical protein
MYAVHKCLAAATAVLLSLAVAPALADDVAAPTREQLQQAAEAALTAKEQATAQLESTRMEFLQTETTLLEARRNLKQAEQQKAEAEGRLAAEQEAATKAAEAAKAPQEAKKAADDALAAAKEAVNPDLSDEDTQKAEAAVAEAQKKLDEATTPAAEATAAAETAQKTLEATQKVIAAAMAAIEAGNQQIESLQAKLEQSQQQLTAAETQLAASTAEWVTHQGALEKHLRQAGEWVSFTDEVAPILNAKCVACHNAKTAKGRLNLVSYAALMKGGESGDSIEPGDADSSYLCSLIEDGSMPAEADPLADEEIALIKKWVALGGRLDAGADPNLPLIRIMPRPQQPDSPESYRLAIPVTALAFSPDGATLASSGYHEVLLWNVADGTLLRRIGNMAERIYDLEFHPDGQRLAIAAGTPGQFGEVRIVNATDGSVVRDLTVIEDVAFGVSFSPDGTRLACAGGDRTIRVFDVETGAEQVVIEDHADWVMAIAFSPDGSRLASASRDKTAKLFDAATGDALQTFNSHGDVVYGVGFFPDGSHVATCGADDRIRTWATENGAQKQEIRGFGGDVFGLQVLPDGQAVSCSEDKSARLHTLGDGKEVRKFTGHAEWVYAVAAHADSKRAATGSYDGEVRLWNLEDGSQVLTFRAAPGIEQVSK